jgi:ABC-type phosphate transport system substrate-binding protein
MSGFALSLGVSAAGGDVLTVVSAKSVITTLSKDQVAEIFLGKTSRFPDGTQAVPIDQTEASSVREEFYNKVTGKSQAQLKAHWSKIIFTGRGQPPKIASSSAEVKKRLAEDAFAIGYIDEKDVDARVRALPVP